MLYKSKFNILFEEIMSNLKKESGNAVPNVSHGILKENIQPTIDYFEQMIFLPLGITQDMWTSEIGSTGKKDISGDIDLAVNSKEIAKHLNLSTGKDVFLLIQKKLEENNIFVRYNKNNKATDNSQLNCAFPIQGSSQQGELIQIDLFPSTSLEFTKFNKHSPAQGVSKYKGATRSDFLGGIIKVISLAVLNDGWPEFLPSNFVNKPYTTDNGSEYPGLIFSYNSLTDHGLFKANSSWIGKRGNINADPKTYKTELLYDNPQEMIDGLFGVGKYTVDDFDSFESIWNNVLFDSKFPYPEYRDKIIKHMYHVCVRANKVIPDEILQYMEEHNNE